MYIIYGAGYSGLLLCDLMLEQGICPVCIFDKDKRKQGKKWHSAIDIVDPEKVGKGGGCTHVIVAHLDEAVYMTIRKYLLNLGYSHIEHIYEFAQREENAAIFQNQKMILRIDAEKTEKNRDRIEKTEKLLCDEKSRLVYRQIINSLRQKKLSGISALSVREQYFAYDVYTKIIGEVFVDAGGGPDGDVLKFFLKCNGNDFSRYYLIDPDFEEKGWELPGAAREKIEFIHKAAGEKNGNVHVRNYMSMNSVICGSGERLSECIRLDDFYFSENPTFLKIDTEGYERRVLSGAENMITRCRPVIACAIYHREEDFWELPLYLHERLADYKFYIRSYLNVSETILYAVPRERWV